MRNLPISKVASKKTIIISNEKPIIKNSKPNLEYYKQIIISTSFISPFITKNSLSLPVPELSSTHQCSQCLLISVAYDLILSLLITMFMHCAQWTWLQKKTSLNVTSCIQQIFSGTTLTEISIALALLLITYYQFTWNQLHTCDMGPKIFFSGLTLCSFI